MSGETLDPRFQTTQHVLLYNMTRRIYVLSALPPVCSRHLCRNVTDICRNAVAPGEHGSVAMSSVSW